jgi:uncharacterized protein (TIGR03382 family)
MEQRMKQLIIAAVVVLLSAPSVLAQTANTSISPVAERHAPSPLMGAGPVGLVIGAVGFGVYWLVRRRRGKTEV